MACAGVGSDSNECYMVGLGQVYLDLVIIIFNLGQFMRDIKNKAVFYLDWFS